jgi:hypothetical protein
MKQSYLIPIIALFWATSTWAGSPPVQFVRALMLDLPIPE